MITRASTRNLFYIIAPLLLGIGLYVVRFHQPYLPYWTLYNLPDGLWLYSFLFTISFIWQQNRAGIIWAITITFGSISTEYLQKLHIIPGTFDCFDIFAYCIAALIASPQFFPIHRYTMNLKSYRP